MDDVKKPPVCDRTGGFLLRAAWDFRVRDGEAGLLQAS
jgi:hypothetical protein